MPREGDPADLRTVRAGRRSFQGRARQSVRRHSDRTGSGDRDRYAAEFAERLAAVANAPPALVHQLIRADEIVIAGPLLRRSPLIDEPTLIDIARGKGQEHLLAISGRPSLSIGVTDVIIRRGDREVVRSVAGNAGARFLRRDTPDWSSARAMTEFSRSRWGSAKTCLRRCWNNCSPPRPTWCDGRCSRRLIHQKADQQDDDADRRRLEAGRAFRAISRRPSARSSRAIRPKGCIRQRCWSSPRRTTTRNRSPCSRRCRECGFRSSKLS